MKLYRSKKYKHRVELEVPPDEITIIEIGGYTFLRSGANQFQCATCLSLMGMRPVAARIMGEVRPLKLIKDCDCPPQK